MEEHFTVNLEGGRPWGFTLQGGTDFRSPLRVGRVTPGRRAAQAGLVGGDYILAINETPCDGLKHLQAQQLVVKALQELTLVCTKQRPALLSPAGKPTQSFSFPSPPPATTDYQYKPPTPTSSQPHTPRTPVTPSEPIAKPQPPPVTWSTPAKAPQAGGGVANGEGGGASMDVFDTILQDIETFTGDLAQGTAKTDPAQQEVNGTPNMDEWEVIDAPPTEEFQSYQHEGGGAKDQIVSQPPEKPEEPTVPEPDRPAAKSPSPDPATKVAMTTKSSGWYQQMFKGFHQPGPTVGEKRGDPVEEKPRERQRKASDSEDNPSSYNYDHRGLRVRSSSFSKVESTSAEVKSEPRPRTKLPADPTMTTEDVMHALKRSTSFKSNRRGVNERAGKSRDYWKKVETAAQEKERRRSSESRPRSYSELPQRSPDNYTTKMMHPLLRDAEDSVPTPNPQPSTTQASSVEPATSEPDPQDVFTRIDASKLHGAMENAVVMGTLEKEGVPTTALPLSAPVKEKEKKAERRKSKELKPPPSEKARALYNFDAQTTKELSFKKGDIIDLTHSVDDNWLEGGVDGRKGIFPKAYVRVLTEEQIQELAAPKEEKPLEQAKALYDFEAQTAREISFSKGDILGISRKIDDNWYEGFHGDQKGIFPVAYVQILEASQ